MFHSPEIFQAELDFGMNYDQDRRFSSWFLLSYGEINYVNLHVPFLPFHDGSKFGSKISSSCCPMTVPFHYENSKCLDALTVVEDRHPAVGTTAVIQCGGSSGGRVRRWRRGRAGGGSTRSRAGRTPARGRIPRRWQHAGRRRLPDHVYLLLVVVLRPGRWRLDLTAAVRPWVGLPLLGHEAPRHLYNVSGSPFITPLACVSSSSTSAPLWWRREPLQLSTEGGVDGRTGALINVVSEMLKSLLLPSSGGCRSDVEGVFKSASSRGGRLCRGISVGASWWLLVAETGQRGSWQFSTCTETGSVVGTGRRTSTENTPQPN
jgi:hypothetical protein